MIVLSEQLAKTLIQVLKKLGLEVAPRKCNNFIVNGNEAEHRIMGLNPESNFKKRKREQVLQRMEKDVARLQSERKQEKLNQLPFRWT